MKIFRESLIITFWIGIGALVLWCTDLAGILPDNSVSHRGTPFIELELPEVHQVWQRGEAVFVDARAAKYFKLGHIPGAVNIPVNRVTEMLSVLPTNKDAYLITYCGSISCPIAYILREFLLEEGYRNVQVFPSGILGWESAGYPLEKAGFAHPDIYRKE